MHAVDANNRARRDSGEVPSLQDSAASHEWKSACQVMATNLLRIRRSAPEATLLVLTGNLHGSTEKRTPWPELVPMGWHLAQSVQGVKSPSLPMPVEPRGYVARTTSAGRIQ